MKKFTQRGVLFPIIGLAFVALLYLLCASTLVSSGILGLFMFILIIPATVLLLTSILLGIRGGGHNAKIVYVAAIVSALLMAAIVGIFSFLYITDEVIENIQNVATSEGFSVSLSTDNGASTVQSVFLFIALSGIGAFIGTRFSKKKGSVSQPLDSYDS